MGIINLGIVAHVDAGKTSLTERLLFDAGVIDRLGSVDAGSTQTDSLALERRRGITIKTAVATFTVGSTTINLIDTPGHPDFIAEVERALRVLDGAVLVVSAVEGIQAQTRVLLRTLQRLAIPTIFFVNKIDRMGADPDRVTNMLIKAIYPAPSAPDISSTTLDISSTTPDGSSITQGSPRPTITSGSALTGQGIDELRKAIVDHLPRAEGDPAEPLKATVFKIDQEHAAYVRVFSGTIKTRDRIGDGKVTSIDDGRTRLLTPGQIGRIKGLRGIRIGDSIGEQAESPPAFAPPTLQSVVVPKDSTRRQDLHRAMQRLAEQDPLINLRVEDEITVDLYGEVQKEVIASTLAEDFGIEAIFGDTAIIHKRRPRTAASAGAVIHKDGNPHQATLELRVEPGTGVEFDIPVGDIPMYVYKTRHAFEAAISRYTSEVLETSGLIDTKVTVTRCGYMAPLSTAGDYRRLVPELIAKAVAAAGTELCEPIHRFTIEGPGETLPTVLGVLPRHRATPEHTTTDGGRFRIDGTVPAASLAALGRAIPGLTHGEGSLETAFEMMYECCI